MRNNLNKAKEEILDILKKYNVRLESRPLDNFIDDDLVNINDVDTFCYLYDEDTEEEVDLIY